MSKLKDAVGKRTQPAKRKKKQKAQEEPSGVDDKPPSRSRRRRTADRSPKAPPKPKAASEEPEAVQAARAMIKGLVAQVTEGRPKVSVDLVLAIVNQETGNHAAANMLIDEFKLDEAFGIKKF